MNKPKSIPVVISLGGSLLVPDGIDAVFIKNFIETIKKRADKGERFVVITGGGKICRRYQQSAKEIGVVDEDMNDWIGIYATRMNGQFLRILFGSYAHKEVINDPKELSWDSPVIIAGGEKPGQSTDSVAVYMAREVGAKSLINLSNVDYVYDKDPRVSSDAKKIEKISWVDFRKIIPKMWQPGLSAPFDPIASASAERMKLEVVFMNGADLSNFENYLDGKAFIGTLIA